VTAAITDYQGRKVGFRVGGKVSGTSPWAGPYGCVYIQGGGHSFTGDVIITGRNEITFNASGVVARGNVYVNDGGWLYVRNSGQISRSSIVTLNNGAFAFHSGTSLTLMEKFHRLVVTERGYINFHYKPNLHKDRSLYLDDLMISDRGELGISDWVNGATKLLVRKDSENLADASKAVESQKSENTITSTGKSLRWCPSQRLMGRFWPRLGSDSCFGKNAGVESRIPKWI